MLREQFLKPVQFGFVVGRVAQVGIGPGWFFKYRLFSAEGFEAGFSVVRPHAALSNAAERQMVVSKMIDGIVNAAAAKVYIFEDTSLKCGVVTEQVEGKW